MQPRTVRLLSSSPRTLCTEDRSLSLNALSVVRGEKDYIYTGIYRETVHARQLPHRTARTHTRYCAVL